MPATTHGVNGSPSSHTPNSTVLIGPTMPACADSVAPMRSMAIITISTGAKVHSVALSSDSHSTGSGTSAADGGRSTNNCTMHSTQATLVAAPVRRRAPRRCTP